MEKRDYTSLVSVILKKHLNSYFTSDIQSFCWYVSCTQSLLDYNGIFGL